MGHSETPQPGRIRQVLDARDSRRHAAMAAAGEAGGEPPRPPAVRRKRRRYGWYAAAAAALLSVGATLVWELETSTLQSHLFARYATDITHWVEEGRNPALGFPAAGPYDARLGYTRLPEILPRLEARGFEITAQARVSERFQEAVDRGLYPIYEEKPQAGLQVLDRIGSPVYGRVYPEKVIPRFADVPPLVAESLLFVENRRLLDEHTPYQNPVVDWRRISHAVTQFGMRAVAGDRPVPGASTLATQLEKFRHSPGGVTPTPREKLRQMLSASLRAYRDGRETLGTRERILLDYLNGVPLSAIANQGEVHGLLDGLWFWFGMESEVLDSLHAPVDVERAGPVYRAVLSLIVASRGPSFYLASTDGRRALTLLTDAYLRLLEAEGVVSADLARAARAAQPELLYRAPAPVVAAAPDRKAANAIRTELLQLLGTSSLYELDRYDLLVETAIDQATQRAISEELHRLGDPANQVAAGLTGFRLLPERGSSATTYAFVLYESAPDGNRLRVQTDTFRGPLDVNRQTRLELGSTAKLRTLITYLETVEAIYQELWDRTPAERTAYLRVHDDPLTRWLGELLARRPTLELDEALVSAMTRHYSASPAEQFFTAGGVHRFSNFDRTFDHRAITVEEAFHQSVNLVFIRMMRDIVRYHVRRLPDATAALQDPTHPARRAYLERFADHEGRIFLTRFHGEHTGRTPEQSIDRLLAGRTRTAARLARVYRAVLPEADVDALGAFMTARLPGGMPPRDELERLFARTAPEAHGLADLAYLAGIHPLELWVARYLIAHSEASLAEVIAASRDARLESYAWLFRTSRRNAQDERIRIVLENDAFVNIHRSWQRLGYPFPSLVPSYATSLGSSGDNPQALAELVGILVNDGLRRPQLVIEALHFAVGTPFETHLAAARPEAARVMSPEVARTVRAAMTGVVRQGTGRRLDNVFRAADGTLLPLGGKTGTGDNRLRATGAGGRIISERPRNRTAAFVFFVGNYYGVVSVYVEGEQSGDYRFTSALPAQILRHLAPALEPLLRGEQQEKRLTTAVGSEADASGMLLSAASE